MESKAKECAYQRILQSSLELFAKYGYHGTTVEKIAKHAGVSKGLSYTYFKSKESILESLLESAINQHNEMFQTSLHTQKTPQEKISALIDSSLEICYKSEAEKDKIKLLYSIVLQPQTAIVVKEIKKKMNEEFSETLKELSDTFAAIGIADSDLEVEFFRSNVTGIILMHLIRGDEFDVSAMVKNLKKRYDLEID